MTDRFVIIPEDEWKEGLDEVASNWFHAAFITKRAFGNPEPQELPLTFERFAAVNADRCDHWTADLWTGADYSNEMGGECGEAQNVVKKLRRIETGVKAGADTETELLYDLAEELADVIICAHLVAHHYGLNLAEALPAKFNKTSAKHGLPHRL